MLCYAVRCCCCCYCSVYLICLILVRLSVCLYFRLLVSRLPPPGSILASPVQSTWQSSTIPSSRLFWLGLFLSKQPHLTSLLTFSPSTPLKASRACAAHHSTAHNPSCRLGTSLPSSHIVSTSPLRVNPAGSHFPESTLVPEASSGGSSSTCPLEQVSSDQASSHSCFTSRVSWLASSSNRQRRAVRSRDFCSTFARLD